jgi:hypothetical protein
LQFHPDAWSLSLNHSGGTRPSVLVNDAVFHGIQQIMPLPRAV